MKKILALALALIMVLGLATTVSAAEADLSGHTYTAYQIFKGTQAEGEDELGNIEWGDGVNGPALLAALKADNTLKATFDKCETAKDVAEAMTGWADKSENAMAFAKLAYANKTGEGIACENGTTSLNAGYYLVVDTTVFEENAENTVYNLALLQLTQKGTFKIENKTDVPEVEKKVKDTNDTTGEITDWQDSADHDIGDVVPFQLTATLPDNYADYSAYKLAFNDTFTHFEQVAIVDVYLANAEGAKVADFAESDYSNNTTDGGFTVTFANLKTTSIAAKIGNSMKVVVEYTAVLSADAEIGAKGNPNEVYLEYSNNPNWVPDADGDGQPDGDEPTGETPKDVVIVFTYEAIVNKVNGQNQPLKGATFTLYKKLPAAPAEGTEGTDYIVETADGTTTYWAVIGDVNGTDATTFEWKGLDDGEYMLKETVTPAGYNTIDPIKFTITAEHDKEAVEPKLIKLESTLTDAVVDQNAGTITGTVMNQAGTTLPETGGMGTTLFYAIGGLLVAAAVVLLVTKKRMASAE